MAFPRIVPLIKSFSTEDGLVLDPF